MIWGGRMGRDNILFENYLQEAYKFEHRSVDLAV